MRSVSGIRGIVGIDFTPDVVCRHAVAFGRLMTERSGGAVVLARDSRESGPAFVAAARDALQATGVAVIDCGLVPTPTAQLAVEHHGAAGAIIVTASHNPVEWNALKFVGPDGLFLDESSASRLFSLAEDSQVATVSNRGSCETDSDAIARHVERVLALPYIEVDAVRARGFRVALDCVRGAGGAIMPLLLEQLGCTVNGIDLETDGRFPRAPEPEPSNLGRLCALVTESDADVGLAVDPDVDRLALVDEGGVAIGEDYTLAFGVRAVLDRRRGPVVVNLSTSMVVDDVARGFGITVERAPVGEAIVARALQAADAVVGGEGNGGVILPDFHLGRDAPLAAALVLDLLARTGETVSALVSSQPRYVIVKAKAGSGGDMAAVYAALERRFVDATADRHDGLRLAWPDRWLHVRPSGTEPIVRLIAEAPSVNLAEALVAEARQILDGRL